MSRTETQGPTPLHRRAARHADAASTFCGGNQGGDVSEPEPPRDLDSGPQPSNHLVWGFPGAYLPGCAGVAAGEQPEHLSIWRLWQSRGRWPEAG